jgi:environmental stress-induced protein Ves
MISFQVIRAADCPHVPWRNGGGTTREIAVFPPDAGIETFLWRLSMARVEVIGPFSAFEGIDRTLAVLDGTLALTGPDLAVRLDASAAPHSFDGSARVVGEPLGGPVLDLNSMVRRGRFACTMTRLSKGLAAHGEGHGFIVALEAQEIAGVTLDRLDCARFAGPLTVAGEALFVNFRNTFPTSPGTAP